ncbi:MAG: hypothetical protein L6R40_008734, partial [Gallowayella cf. fulva]
MKIEIRECQTKISPTCTGTFQRVPGRGRPPVACPDCKASKVKPAATAKVVEVEEPDTERTCPCGQTFHIKLGRGRKASKCDDCRANGPVYRADEDGELQAIHAETLAEEQREIREQAGKERAERLVIMMGPLLRDRERK